MEAATEATSMTNQQALAGTLSLDGIRATTPTAATIQRSSSPMISPTRTLRLTTAEQNIRERNNTPVRGADVLVPRQRSNPRTTRTHESPLDPDELRRRGRDDDDDNDSHHESSRRDRERRHQSNEGQRITIRPLAGSAVGTVARTRIREERPQTPKSRKQGPSHRKVRRWNNDHFDSLANEIAAMGGGSAAADVLAKAHRDAHLFRSIYDPKTNEKDVMRRFIEDKQMKYIRDEFFEGSTPVPESVSKVAVSKKATSAYGMMNRIDSRLRRVIIKACTNSYPATQVVRALEDYVVASFAGKKHKAEDRWWDDLLLESPTVTRKKGVNDRTVQFFFDADGSTGGFHRLLLHAICQFHGLKAVSRVVDISIGNKSKARALTVTGFIEDAHCFRLLEYVEAGRLTNVNTEWVQV